MHACIKKYGMNVTHDFSSFELAVAKECTTFDRHVSSAKSSLRKAGPWSVCMTSGVPNRLKCWKMHPAVSDAP